MGAIKSGIYTKTQEELALIAKALAHPGRIAIIQELMKKQHCQCGNLAEAVGLAQSTISQHLKELKNAGIIQGAVDDSRLCYCLTTERLDSFVEFVLKMKDSAKKSLANCC